VYNENTIVILAKCTKI